MCSKASHYCGTDLLLLLGYTKLAFILFSSRFYTSLFFEGDLARLWASTFPSDAVGEGESDGDKAGIAVIRKRKAAAFVRLSSKSRSLEASFSKVSRSMFGGLSANAGELIRKLYTA